MLVTAEEMLKKAEAGKYAVDSSTLTTLSGQKQSCLQHRNSTLRLSLVYPKVQENT